MSYRFRQRVRLRLLTEVLTLQQLAVTEKFLFVASLQRFQWATMCSLQQTLSAQEEQAAGLPPMQELVIGLNTFTRWFAVLQTSHPLISITWTAHKEQQMLLSCGIWPTLRCLTLLPLKSTQQPLMPMVSIPVLLRQTRLSSIALWLWVAARIMEVSRYEMLAIVLK